MILNLLRKDGPQLSGEIKNDADLPFIPIIVLTTSETEQDVWRPHKLHANRYLTKPIAVDAFINKIRSLEEFRLTGVRLPSK